MKKKNNEIKEFILNSLKSDSQGITRRVVERFGVNRRTVVDYLRELIDQNLIVADGRTKSRTYRLRTLVDRSWTIPITERTEEHVVWKETIAPILGDVPENVRDICGYGFQEMFNNAMDHSGARGAQVSLRLDAASIDMIVTDPGIGIFEKIRAAQNLSDPREALLELSKGRFTTAPAKHSGEGIFFTSRMFDRFFIHSRGLVYYSKERGDDWLFEMGRGEGWSGTSVHMEISSFAKRSKQEVFDRFSGIEAGFFRTRVPVALAKYDREKLVSRSQARRVLARFEKFKEVLLDFEGVETIGQPFADEIFRVFAREHPEIEISFVGASEQVKKMIAWVRGSDPMQGPLR